MDRQEALEQITRMGGFKAVPVKDTGAVKFLTTDAGMAIREGRGQIRDFSKEGYDSLLSMAHVSDALTKSIQPRTLTQVLTDVIVPKGQITLLTKDGQVVDVAPADKWHPMDAERVFRTLDRAVPDFDVHNLRTLPHHTVSLELLGVDEPRVVAPGVHDIGERVPDLIKAGVLVEFSPVGMSNPLIQAFALRLICANGAVANDVLRRYEYGRGGAGEGDDVWQFFRRSARDAYQSIGAIVERYQAMKAEGIPAQDRAAVLAAMIKAAGLSKEVAAAVRARAIDMPPQTAYDMYQAITWAATHGEREGARQRRAQLAAANFADETQHARLCPACGRGH